MRACACASARLRPRALSLRVRVARRCRWTSSTSRTASRFFFPSPVSWNLRDLRDMEMPHLHHAHTASRSPPLHTHTRVLESPRSPRYGDHSHPSAPTTRISDWDIGLGYRARISGSNTSNVSASRTRPARAARPRRQSLPVRPSDRGDRVMAWRGESGETGRVGGDGRRGK